VADFFCGSGTTPMVAARLQRKFLTGDVSYRAVHTTRTRLVAASAPAFIMKHTAGLETTRDDTHLAENISLAVDEKSIILAANLSDGIDYWEIDPSWDGKLFRSATQAVRPRGKGIITDQLKLPAKRGNQPICVRVVDIHGNTCVVKV